MDSRVRGESDSPFRNAAEQAFANIVNIVEQEQVDLFLIVGDLFDHNRIQDDDIAFVESQLRRVDCPVVLIPGNHDVHDERSVWHRFNFSELGSNVVPLTERDGEVHDFANLQVRIWGRGMVEHSPDNRPLADVASRRDGYWHVGMAHGHVVPERVGFASSQISFAEIEASGLDYLALGHVHVWEEVTQGDTIAFYSGSPVAAFASSGGGHFASVTLDIEHGITVNKRVSDVYRTQRQSAMDRTGLW